ncbi:6330_t:CDS:2 [Racocetra persica]|uniref:6330_t:CDS:1 n=1 Tax=Racocetra persica TaxID=160502 RepID=A0ACA9LGP1_9GLOM|nr:6330_t:CDS:2 [Racocetra persica]
MKDLLFKNDCIIEENRFQDQDNQPAQQTQARDLREIAQKDENPVKWVEVFKKAANANNWTLARKIKIASEHLLEIATSTDHPNINLCNIFNQEPEREVKTASQPDYQLYAIKQHEKPDIETKPNWKERLKIGYLEKSSEISIIQTHEDKLEIPQEAYSSDENDFFNTYESEDDLEKVVSYHMDAAQTDDKELYLNP